MYRSISQRTEDTIRLGAVFLPSDTSNPGITSTNPFRVSGLSYSPCRPRRWYHRDAQQRILCHHGRPRRQGRRSSRAPQVAGDTHAAGQEAGSGNLQSRGPEIERPPGIPKSHTHGGSPRRRKSNGTGTRPPDVHDRNGGGAIPSETWIWWDAIYVRWGVIFGDFFRAPLNRWSWRVGRGDWGMVAYV
jgi:hypothetical protein